MRTEEDEVRRRGWRTAMMDDGGWRMERVEDEEHCE